MVFDVLTVENTRKVDEIMIKKMGIPGIFLMENAGRSVAQAIREYFKGLFPLKVIVVSGKGNNGGDGFVTARHLANYGSNVKVFVLCKKSELKGDAKYHYNLLKKYENINVIHFNGKRNFLDELIEDVYSSDLVVDAIFGTGFKGEVKGLYREIIRIINEMSQFVVSIDIPSGINGNSSTPKGDHVEANMTIALGSLKPAHIFPPAEDACGEVYVGKIGAEERIFRDYSEFKLVNYELASITFRERPLDSHKGVYGHTVIIGGSYGKAGAVYLSAISALKAGAGLVTIVEPNSIYPITASHSPEIMHFPVRDKNGMIDPAEISKIVEFLEDKDSVVIGPGMGVDKKFKDFILKIVNTTDIPVIIDADGLNNLGTDVRKLRREDVFLTPHPGEFIRISGYDETSIMENRWLSGLKFHNETELNFVLKGYRSTVFLGGIGYVVKHGNPGMATAGSGDVLSGILGGLLGSHYPEVLTSDYKFLSGVLLHSVAGDIASEKIGEESITAMDIVENIAQAIDLIKGKDEEIHKHE